MWPLVPLEMNVILLLPSAITLDRMNSVVPASLHQLLPKSAVFSLREREREREREKEREFIRQALWQVPLVLATPEPKAGLLEFGSSRQVWAV
jgi:hypothetical protein